MARPLVSLLLAAALALSGGLIASPACAAAASSAAMMERAAPPGAARLPGYLRQNNAERAKVQPGNNAPMWRDIKQHTGFSSLPDPEAGVLIQPQAAYPGSAFTSAGEAWRQTRNRLLIPVGGWLLIIAAAGIGVFYMLRGKIRLEHKPTGRKIERFTPFERFMHWVLAFSFIALAVSGIVIMFGKFFLLPILGSAFFGWLTYALKTIHNFVGPLFGLSLVIVLLTFVRDNLPSKKDLAWLAKGGGLFGGREAPSARFNAGEKIWFWVGVLFFGLLAVASGLVLDKLVPNFSYTRGAMQVAEIVHVSTTILLMAMAFGHIYIGSIGMEGALDGMRTGYVDESWAKQHHALWLDDINAGKIPAQRSGQSVQAPVPMVKPKS
ncbi:MAG: formate dehydrogenase subunit gamma [Proteobacteria bacterium]|nr:formate dehydrogenase subunit gamma [Pseudomonadota bacterium]